MRGETELRLIGETPKDEDVEEFVHWLMADSVIKRVILLRSGIGDLGASLVGYVLEDNGCLEQLNVGSNAIGEDGAKLLADALLGNTRLQKLVIWDNRIG